MSSSPPFWLLVLLPIIDFGLPAILLYFGYLLLCKTLKVNRTSNLSTINCFKCHYDMRVTTSLTCTECGYTHKSRAQLYPSKRTFYLKLFLGTILCLPALGVLYISLTYYPTAYLESRRTESTIAFLRSYGAQCTPTSDVTLDNPSAWTLQVWSWIRILPIMHTFYDGSSPSERRKILYPRLIYAEHPASPIAETFLNWTWCPSRNYQWYFPLPQYWDVNITNGPAFTLTPDDARRLCAIRGLHQIRLGPQIIVNGPALAALASFPKEDSWGDLQIGNYYPTTWDNTGWLTEGAIKALSRIDIDARHDVADSFLTMLASCPQLNAICIHASAQSPHEKILVACFKLKNLTYLSFQGLEITSRDLEKVKTLNNLQEVILDFPSNSLLTDADLAHLSNLPKLQRITIKNSTHISGKFLLSLNSEINSIALSNIPFNDDIFAMLISHTHLTEISLQGTQVTPAAFKKYICGASSQHLENIFYDQPIDIETCQLLFSDFHANIAVNGLDDEQLNLFLSKQTAGRLEIYNHRLSDTIAAQVKAGVFNLSGASPSPRSSREVVIMNAPLLPQ